MYMPLCRLCHLQKTKEQNQMIEKQKMTSESKKSVSTGEDSKSDDQDKQLMDLTNLRLNNDLK